MAKDITITRKIHKDGNLFPEAYNLLKILPEEFLYHISHNDRHPFSRYSNSLQRISEGYLLVLDEVDAINSAILDPSGALTYDFFSEALCKAQKDLLDALLSHIDDCYAVLKSFCPPNIKNTEVYVDKWLEKEKHPTFSSFKSKIEHYKRSFNKIANKIKHDGGRLRSLVIVSGHKGIVQQSHKSKMDYRHVNARLAGYYLEGMQSDGFFGPDLKVHPDNGAISLNYDLRYHFAYLYRVSKWLSEAVRHGFKVMHQVDLPYPPKIEKMPQQDQWDLVVERITKIPKLFYQNEFKKKAPDIRTRGSGRSTSLEIILPGSKGMPWHGDSSVQLMFPIDAVSPLYRPPYAR